MTWIQLIILLQWHLSLWVGYIRQRVNVVSLKLMCWKQNKWPVMRIWVTLTRAVPWWLTDCGRACPKPNVFQALTVCSGSLAPKMETGSWVPEVGEVHWEQRVAHKKAVVHSDHVRAEHCVERNALGDVWMDWICSLISWFRQLQ